jgi:hypothetical protein
MQQKYLLFVGRRLFAAAAFATPLSEFDSVQEAKRTEKPQRTTLSLNFTVSEIKDWRCCVTVSQVSQVDNKPVSCKLWLQWNYPGVHNVPGVLRVLRVLEYGVLRIIVVTRSTVISVTHSHCLPGKHLLLSSLPSTLLCQQNSRLPRFGCIDTQ